MKHERLSCLLESAWHRGMLVLETGGAAMTRAFGDPIVVRRARPGVPFDRLCMEWVSTIWHEGRWGPG